MSENKTIEARTREQIAEFLPQAMAKVMMSYRKHMNKETEGNFAETHRNAKVALGHMELLIKLAKWADLPDKNQTAKYEADLLASMIAEAEAELSEQECEEVDN